MNLNQNKFLFWIFFLFLLVLPSIRGEVEFFTATFVIPATVAPFVFYEDPTTGIGSFNQDFIEVNVSVSTSGTLKNVTIYLYNSTHELINSSNSTSSPLFVNFTSLPDGIYYINATAYDTDNNNGSTATRQIILDTTNPIISVFSPENITYSYADILINFTSTDDNLDTLWYYNTTINITYTTPIYESLPPGTYSFTFYANDSVGNLNSTNVVFTIIHTTRAILDYKDFVTGDLTEICFEFNQGTLCFNSSGVIT